jgi:dextranase
MPITAAIIPEKAQFRPGEDIYLELRVQADSAVSIQYSYSVWDLHQPVWNGLGTLEAMGPGEMTESIRIGSLNGGSGAYGIFMSVRDGNGNTAEAETAFDVAEHWRDAPRYGFLSDFTADEENNCLDIEFMNRCHINLVQFYDWMYRHDRLIPDEEDFVDPLGRPMSLRTVKSKIGAARERGMGSIAYAAVYASLRDYIEAYPEQGLYQNDGQPYSLGNFFFIMDISGDSAWTRHIIGEFSKAIALGFDGLHMDQYGFPKKAVRQKDGGMEVVALKDLYPRFIDLVREALPDAMLIFNNVSDYPVRTTSQSSVDVMYTEIWDPATNLRDVKDTIDRSRSLSGKHSILAAYLPAFHPEHPADSEEAETGARIAMAAIFASGGTHLLLGENGKLLADPYYVKHGTIPAGFLDRIVRYYDFLVMYRNLLSDLELEDITMAFTGGINREIVFQAEGKRFMATQALDSVWTIVKEKPGYYVLHLINLYGLDNEVWHAPKTTAPPPVTDIQVSAELLEEVEGVYWASPDGASIRPDKLEHKWVHLEGYSGNRLRFTLPRLDYWSMVYIPIKPGSPQGNP